MFTNNIRNTSVSACLAIAASTYFCLSKIQGLASRSVPKPRAFMSRSGSLNNYGAWLSAKFKNHLEFEVCRHLCKVASSFNLTGTTNPVVTRKRLATVVPSFCHMPCQGMSAIGLTISHCFTKRSCLPAFLGLWSHGLGVKAICPEPVIVLPQLRPTFSVRSRDLLRLKSFKSFPPNDTYQYLSHRNRSVQLNGVYLGETLC